MEESETVVERKYLLERMENYFRHLPRLDRQPLPSLTISRQCGAGLARIGRPLLEYLDSLSDPEAPPWAVFDPSIIGRVIEENRLPRLGPPYSPELAKFPVPIELGENLARPAPDWTLFHHTTHTVRSLCNTGHAIVVGRAGNFVTSDLENTFHLRLVADKERRVGSTSARQGLARAEAAELVAETDKARTRFVRRHTGGDIDDPVGYHLVVTTDHFSDETLVRILGDSLHEWSQRLFAAADPPEPGKVVQGDFPAV